MKEDSKVRSFKCFSLMLPAENRVYFGEMRRTENEIDE
jgi:hypothetical protein